MKTYSKWPKIKSVSDEICQKGQNRDFYFTIFFRPRLRRDLKNYLVTAYADPGQDRKQDRKVITHFLPTLARKIAQTNITFENPPCTNRLSDQVTKRKRQAKKENSRSRETTKRSSSNFKGPPQTRILSPRGDIFRIFCADQCGLVKNS